MEEKVEGSSGTCQVEACTPLGESGLRAGEATSKPSAATRELGKPTEAAVGRFN